MHFFPRLGDDATSTGMVTERTAPVSLDAETLFREYAGFVARFLFRLGVPTASLDDLLQDTFLVAHRNGGYTRGQATPTTYLASIALRLAANQRRRERNHERLKHRASTVHGLGPPDTPLQILEANETMHALQLALSALKPELRSVLVLADLEQESCASIAAGLGLASGTVYWRLHHARKQFAKAVRAQSLPRGHKAGASKEAFHEP